MRLDKEYFFKGWSLMLYVDVQNVYNFKAQQPAILLRQSDSMGNPVTDPADPSRYSLKYINGDSGTILPTIGIMIEL
jgi:hypothetical protein